MSPRSLLASFGVAAALAAGSTAPALAATAVADTNLNVRSCGSMECRVVDVLRRGESVDVQYCEGIWCFVEKRGRDGWVSAKYLSRDRHFYEDDFYEDDYFYDDYDDVDVIVIEPRRRVIRRVDPFVSACIGGPNARFCVYD